MINRHFVMDLVLTCVMVLCVKYVVAAEPGCPACPDAKTGDKHTCPGPAVAAKHRGTSGCPAPRCSDSNTAALVRQLEKQAQCADIGCEASKELKCDVTNETACPCERGECDKNAVANCDQRTPVCLKCALAGGENAKCDDAIGQCAAKKSTASKHDAGKSDSTLCQSCSAAAESVGKPCTCKDKCCGDNCHCGTQTCAPQTAAQDACNLQDWMKGESKHSELVPGETAEAILRIKEKLEAQAGAEVRCPGLNIDLEFDASPDHEARQTQLIEVLRNLDAEHRTEQDDLPLPEDVGTGCELVTQDQAEALRESCASLERTAAQLEAAELYEQADLARQLANDLREEARQASARLRPNVFMSSTPVRN